MPRSQNVFLALLEGMEPFFKDRELPTGNRSYDAKKRHAGAIQGQSRNAAKYHPEINERKDQENYNVQCLYPVIV